MELRERVAELVKLRDAATPKQRLVVNALHFSAAVALCTDLLARVEELERDCDTCDGDGLTELVIGFDSNTGCEQFGEAETCPACGGTGLNVVATLRARVDELERALERKEATRDE